jgi:hypothetical protein
MKGALSSKPNYQFDAEGHLVKATEDEPDEVTFLKESIVVYVEGQSSNHPADVAASNAPEEPPPPEALAVAGDYSYKAPKTEEEVEEAEMEEAEENGAPTSKRGRRGR